MNKHKHKYVKKHNRKCKYLSIQMSIIQMNKCKCRWKCTNI